MTLPDYYSPEHLGMIVPKTKDGRVVFMLPWQSATIAGTTGAYSRIFHCYRHSDRALQAMPCSISGPAPVEVLVDNMLAFVCARAAHVGLQQAGLWCIWLLLLLQDSHMRACAADSSTEITMRPQPKEEEVCFILDAISDYLSVEVRLLCVGHTVWPCSRDC